MAGDAGVYADRAYAHIHYLTKRIGPRPSTGVGERSAADYAAHVLRRVHEFAWLLLRRLDGA